VWRGWESPCKVFVMRVEPSLRRETRHGLRRSFLALLLRWMRRHWFFFYTIQNRMDEKRLRGRGEPWPTGFNRAHLGPGVYAWRHASDAREYRTMLLPARKKGTA
jgi:hypothetical protein